MGTTAQQRANAVLAELHELVGSPSHDALMAQNAKSNLPAISRSTYYAVLNRTAKLRKAKLAAFIMLCLDYARAHRRISGLTAEQYAQGYWTQRYNKALGHTAASSGAHVGVPPAPATGFVPRPALETSDAPLRVLTGLSGVGKTQLAADWIRQRWHDPAADLVMWVPAGSRAEIMATYAQAAKQVLGADPKDTMGAVRQLLSWLSTNDRWLIVLDDVSVPQDLSELWPPPTGRTVITTCYRGAGWARPHTTIIPVETLMPTEAGPLSIGPIPRQLPAGRRQFVGRQQELDELTAVLDAAVPETGTVIVTAIAGTAGIGKTALAMHWAHQIKSRFPDGQLHVNLRGFDLQAPVDPSQALRGFLEALGVVPSGIPGDLDARAALYRTLVADRRLLIMLDNAASADQVRPLLPNTPTCLVIVTSRNRLDGLAVREGAHHITLDVLPPKDALSLLAQRIAPDRLATEREAAADLIDLCARLPLALSIVAARATNRPLCHLVRQLEDERSRLDTLNLGDPDLDIRVVFSWSYRALSPEAARLFRLLGLHPGPDIDDHACGSLVERPRLTELTAAHLLEEYRPNRFRFHDLLRTYAAERAESDEPPSGRHNAMRGLIDYYISTATLADFRIQPCRDGVVRTLPVSACAPIIANVSEAMEWFTAENASVLALITLATKHGFNAQVDQLAWACDTFLPRTGQRHERVAANRMALDAVRRSGDVDAQIRNLWYLSRSIARMGCFVKAAQCLVQASALNQNLGDEYHQVAIHLAYVQLLDIQRRHPGAIYHARKALDLAQQTSSQMYQADALTALSWEQAYLGRSAEGLPLCERALEIYTRIGHHEGKAYAHHVLGFIYQELRNYEQAIHCYECSIDVNREIRSRYWEAVVLDRLGDAYQKLRENHRAQLAWQQAYDILDTLRHPDAKAVQTKCAQRQVLSDTTLADKDGL